MVNDKKLRGYLIGVFGFLDRKIFNIYNIDFFFIKVEG